MSEMHVYQQNTGTAEIKLTFLLLLLCIMLNLKSTYTNCNQICDVISNLVLDKDIAPSIMRWILHFTQLAMGNRQ